MSVRSCRLVPATQAKSCRPNLDACTAQSMATRVEEQAVSMVKQGPVREKASNT